MTIKARRHGGSEELLDDPKDVKYSRNPNPAPYTYMGTRQYVSSDQFGSNEGLLDPTENLKK